MVLCFFLASALGGCGVYRDAVVQGASDIGTVAGVALGVPLGVAAVTVGESFKTAGEVHKHPRLYERYPQNQSGAAGTAKTINYSTRNNRYRTPAKILYEPKQYVVPENYQSRQYSAPRVQYINYDPARKVNYAVHRTVVTQSSDSDQMRFWAPAQELQ